MQVDGDFTWEASISETDDTKMSGKDGIQQNKSNTHHVEKKRSPLLPATTHTKEASVAGEEEKPFELRGMKLKIPKGAFVAIVGRVGSGKSSLLQAMIGEMRKTQGEVR